jgi:hypothetical protein
MDLHDKDHLKVTPLHREENKVMLVMKLTET